MENSLDMCAVSSANASVNKKNSASNSLKMINDLLENSKTLPTTVSDLGSIQLSINELKKRTSELRAQNKDTDIDLTKAHYLLAGSGLAIEDVDNTLESLHKYQMMESHAPGMQAEGEIDHYLKLKKDQIVSMSIDKLLSTSSKDFDIFLDNNLKLDWKSLEHDVGQRFGLYVKNMNTIDNTNSSKHVMDMPKWSSEKSSLLNDSTTLLNVNENYLLRNKFERYAKIIHSFNNCRQQQNHFSLVNEVISMIENFGDSTNRQLLECWKILQAIQEKESIVISSRRYVEKQFLAYVDELYKKNLNEGLPTGINKVKSFIDSKLRGKDNKWLIENLTIVNGIPIWALIFYLLRAGLHQEALEVAINNHSSFNKVEKTFLIYFKAFITAKSAQLPVELTTKLHIEYNQHIKSALGGDPFRMAVYKIIGRCDLSSKNISSIALNIEDWLWFHLMLVKEDVSDNDPVYEKYKLIDLQNIILSYGISHFSEYYLQVLLLSGLYEFAVEHACTISKIDGVHIAIGLANCHLLKTTTSHSDKNNSLLVSSGTGNSINFVRLLSTYTTSFRKSDPRIAAEYLLLVGIVNDESEMKLCHEAIRELVLETKEFTILLGRINADGTRIPGVIEERKNLLNLNEMHDYLNKISEQAAYKADEDGRTQDSLMLYQLAENYDIVISIVNDLLGDLLSESNMSKPLTNIYSNNPNDPIYIAETLIHIYMNNLDISKKIQTKNKITNITLLKISEARKTFAAGQWQNTLNLIEEIDLIPLSNTAEIRRSAQEVMNIDKNILKIIPNLLIMIMTCVYNISENLRQSAYQSAIKAQQHEALKNIAKNCSMYAGMIKYKMPKEVYSQLTKLEITLQ
ncbi:hypothetical protein TPHA_0D00740 [Tetrapisispora phaffii CBS 4417]|uniref:Nuclear pore protein n=1 Tax=Tetrapisispora phaffii (strain ATCC 24235 / CBS 4417 / NBRC 1672 / NRRL Y-8282 / UCD 70-5) TaxID=1071381 RepID=G8BS96_TETPH|nr:hypothetical protein TPHA_0D00740 [Tetrapisispora phaffii CBS 4417]CCE62717.1 hypothetical protein TPHA_0D00740 [Tetrapisispora phaffii CBS 4417]